MLLTCQDVPGSHSAFLYVKGVCAHGEREPGNEATANPFWTFANQSFVSQNELLAPRINTDIHIGLQLCGLINPRRACAARVTVLGLSVRLSVRLSVTKFCATTRNKQVKKRHQRVQRYTGFIFQMAIFVKVPCSEVMA